MSLFARRREPAVEERSVTQWLRWVQEASTTSSGIHVDHDTAMRHDAVWACVNKIAQSVAMLPLDVVRYQNGQRVEVSPLPQIVQSPSATMSGIDWRYATLVSTLITGNQFGIVTATNAAGTLPTRIELIPTAQVQDTGVAGEFLVMGRRHQVWPVGDLWHFSAYLLPGEVMGLSPITYHRQAIGAGLAAEKFSSEFFAGGGHPKAILSTDGDPGEQGARAIKDAFMRATSTREPAVMPTGIKYQAIQISPDDSQFIDAQRYSAEQICRVFNVPPELVGLNTAGSSLTYANREDRAQDFVSYTLLFWITKLVDALTQLLPRPQVVKFNTNALLRTSTRARYEAHEIALRNGWRTINEVRKLEDEPAFDGEDYDEPVSHEEREMSVVDVIQKVYTAVGKVITADEARAIINAAGGNLTVPNPAVPFPMPGLLLPGETPAPIPYTPPAPRPDDESDDEMDDD